MKCRDFKETEKKSDCAGRNISYSVIANELLINETFAKQIGFINPADAINRFITIGNSPLPIVGVMQDFNLASVRSAIKPMVYYADLKYGYVMHLALQGNPSTSRILSNIFL